MPFTPAQTARTIPATLSPTVPDEPADQRHTRRYLMLCDYIGEYLVKITQMMGYNCLNCNYLIIFNKSLIAFTIYPRTSWLYAALQIQH
jgi:hypothetical protein